MKRILFMIILGLGGLMPVNRILAQRAVDLFQDYSWEQASLQTARENTGREYQSPPQPATEAITFDKDDESDRELLREDPYAEYIDFPQECRMKDETQVELICC